LNQDSTFRDFLNKNYVKIGPQKEIGKTKARQNPRRTNRSILLTHSKDFKTAEQFRQKILQTNSDYLEEFTEKDLNK
jgi:hypothetical protein